MKGRIIFKYGILGGLMLMLLIGCDSSKSLEILGKTVTQNPYGYAKLCAQLDLKTNRPCKVKLELFEKNKENIVNISKTFEEYETIHQLPILGLYDHYENKLKLSLLDKNENILLEDTIVITTDSTGIPKWDIIANDAVPTTCQYFLSSNLLAPSYIWDRKGEIRAYYSGMFLKKLSNGNYVFSKPNNNISEIDKLGKEIRTYKFPVDYFEANHEIYELPNGNIMAGVKKLSFDSGTKYEYAVIEFDRASGKFKYEWDFEDYIHKQKRSFAKDALPESWFHFNAVIYDSNDHSLIFSGRNQGLLKVGYKDKKMKWFFTPHVDFDQAESEEGKYFLTAVDARGKPYGKTMQSQITHKVGEPLPFHWPIRQHSPIILPSKDYLLHILLYNNDAEMFPAEKKSLMISYVIDENAKTVFQKQVFDANIYSDKKSGVDYNVKENHYLSYSAPLPSLLSEFDHNGKIIFQAKLLKGDNKDLGYRTNYLNTLY